MSNKSQKLYDKETFQKLLQPGDVVRLSSVNTASTLMPVRRVKNFDGVEYEFAGCSSKENLGYTGGYEIVSPEVFYLLMNGERWTKVEKVELTVATHEGMHIDVSQNDKDLNFVIYDPATGKYLSELLSEGQPIAWSIDEAKRQIDYYRRYGSFLGYGYR